MIDSAVEVDTTKLRELNEQGFTIFPGVLTPDLLERLRQVTDEKLDARDEATRNATRAQGSLLWTNTDPLFAELVNWPAALGALASLGFSAPTFSDGYIISKSPLGPRLFWHYDWFAWEDAASYALPAPQLFLMYYLTDTTRENGCLRAIPGSHLQPNPLHTILANPHGKELSEATNLERPEFADRPDEVDVPVKAGDLLVGDARLLHAAHENQTSDRRTLITLWYQPTFDALSPRLQAQIAAKCQPVPGDWPEGARAKMQPIMASAHYHGDAEPYGRTLWRPMPVA